ncbi:hypothetical protein HPB52_000495 [Rhipicephalus sanguineus]|uniref:Uncharacterized protein n=1 Tax=Rhipicephalus sanguineus TaxID=34632 RepID=A0A9D4PC21_RHISA|nr:hypothetical protein HPB52_000495 [Rhipicephalus sanguineus]
MLSRLCPPVKPFAPGYPRAWFVQLDATLAVNGVTAQPLLHDILFCALSAELLHVSAASPSSAQPYYDLCAVVLARYGETYRLLPGTGSDARGSSARRRCCCHPPVLHEVRFFGALGRRSSWLARQPPVVPARAVSRHVSNLSFHAGYLAARPEIWHGHHLVHHSPLARGGFAVDDIRARPSIDLKALLFLPAATSTFLDVSRSSSSCPSQLRPNVRDAATKTESPEDDMPVSPKAAQQANVTPPTTAAVHHPDLCTGPHVPSTVDASPSAGASSEPAETTGFLRSA